MAAKLIQPLTLKEIQTNAPNLSKASKEELMSYLKRISKTANMRLLRLERQGQNTIAMQKLYKRLEDIDAVTIGYRVKVDEGMSKADIKKEIRAVEIFLGSKGSTKQGLKQIKENQLRGLRDTFELMELDDAQAEAMLEAMEQLQAKDREKYIDISEIYRMAYDTKYKKKKGYDYYINLAEAHLGDIDEELQEVLDEVWDNLI